MSLRKPNDGNKKPYISPSQLETYTKCGEQYRRRYLEKHVIPPGVAAVRGTSIHKGAEANFDQKVHTRRDLNPVDIVDISVDTFEKTVKYEDVWLNPEEESIGRKKIVGQAKDATARLANLFAVDLAPKIQPKLVEVTHRIELPGSTHDLLGRLDLIDEADAIDDLKTHTKSKTQADVDANTQMTFYAMLFQNKFKKAPTEIRYSQLLDKKVPEASVIKTTRDAGDFDVLVNRINTVLDGIKAGTFIPAPTGSWACSIRFCGYAPTCKFFKSR